MKAEDSKSKALRAAAGAAGSVRSAIYRRSMAFLNNALNAEQAEALFNLTHNGRPHPHRQARAALQ